MNRNNERHFNQIPEMKSSRTRFNRDQTILTINLEAKNDDKIRAKIAEINAIN